MKEMIGAAKAAKVEELAIQLYTKVRSLDLHLMQAATFAETRGIIIADTKFEFGEMPNGEIILIDEVLTPGMSSNSVAYGDSSRFWAKDKYAVGRGQDSFDKQYLRDWLTSNGLAGKDNVDIPDQVVKETQRKYQEVFEILTGKKWTTCS